MGILSTLKTHGVRLGPAKISYKDQDGCSVTTRSELGSYAIHESPEAMALAIATGAGKLTVKAETSEGQRSTSHDVVDMPAMAYALTGEICVLDSELRERQLRSIRRQIENEEAELNQIRLLAITDLETDNDPAHVAVETVDA